MSRWNVPRSRLLAIVVVGIVMLFILWFGVSKTYFQPRAELLAQIENSRKNLQSIRNARSQQITQAEELDRLSALTLGSDYESVDHHLRSRLNRIKEDIGLTDDTVSTSNHRFVESPNDREFRKFKAFRGRIDFALLDGRISGDGNLEQALRLIHRLHGEPWLKHIDSVRLDADKDGKRFTISVSLTTMYLPGRTPAEAAQWTYDATGFERYLALAQANPFAIPEKPKPVVAQVPKQPKQQKPKPPPRFMYGQWQVTFVGQIGDSAEVWLMNTKSGETRRLVVGETLHEAKLVAARVDTAEFQLDEHQFAVAVGWTLDDRTPVNR